MDAEKYIRCQSLVQQSLKLIASITNQHDVPDLKIGLLLANIQAVRQIIEGKTFYLRCLFLIPQDWQLCKENSILSRDFFGEELYNAGVFLNLAKEFCAGRLFFPLHGCTTINTPVTITSMPALILCTLLVSAITLSSLPALALTSSRFSTLAFMTFILPVRPRLCFLLPIQYSLLPRLFYL